MTECSGITIMVVIVVYDDIARLEEEVGYLGWNCNLWHIKQRS